MQILRLSTLELGNFLRLVVRREHRSWTDPASEWTHPAAPMLQISCTEPISDNEQQPNGTRLPSAGSTGAPRLCI